MKKVTIKIVDDVPCPECGAYWGNPSEDLNFANRPKVGDENNNWWWRCYNPKCKVSYYCPETGQVEH